MYTLAYRNLGIFQENVVNRMLQDVVKSAQPWEATLVGDFLPRGGVHTKITAAYTRPRRERRPASR
jgi:7-cyano-7-deazaguanine reductase